MVMDKERVSSQQDIQVTIPDREANNALSRPIASRSVREAEPQLSPPPDDLPPAPSEAPQPDTVARPAPPARPAAAPASPKTLPPTPLAESVKPISPLTPKDNPPDAARARAIRDGNAATMSAGEAYIVQIGAFGDGGKAASSAADLKKRGFASYTEKVGAMTRLRTGPFRGRDDAEKAAQRVRASGMN